MQTTAVKLYGFILLLSISFTGLAQKTDKVYLKNGDVLTGAIKGMKFAKLSFDMTGPGIIQIKWIYITKIQSNKIFQITTRQGEIVVTVLDSINIKLPNTALDDIVEIVQIKDKFLHRLDGDVNLGLSFAKSTSILQFNFGSSITYRQPNLETNLKINSIISYNTSDSNRSRKQDAAFDVYRKLRNSIYVNAISAWQENTQLGLDNRFLVSLLGGKILFNNNRRRFLTGGGLSCNIEQYTGGSAYQGNLEAVLGLQFKEFQYITPKVSIDTKFLFYAGLTDWGRVRIDFELSSKFEIFKDFNIGLSVYDNLDSKPPVYAPTKNDFGINLTVGYEFGK
jgi:hypothetical protein